jgi:hypothetical protein
MKTFFEFIKLKEMMGSVASIVSCKDLNNYNFQVQGALSNLNCKRKKKNKTLKMKFNTNENVSVVLSQKAEVKTNFPEADFWIVRKGTEDRVGSPTKEFSPEHIGIKVISNDILPGYLYYAIQFIHSTGYFRSLSHGTLKLKNIKVSDVENIRLG